MLSCLVVIIGVQMTLVESSDEGESPIGRDLDSLNVTIGVVPTVAKCSSICNRDHYCFFFGVDDSGICKTFKRFDRRVEYRLYARRPAVTIDFRGSSWGSQNPSILSIEGNAKHICMARGVHVSQVNPELTNLSTPHRIDAYQSGYQLTTYIQNLRRGTIVAATTRDDATGSLQRGYLKTQGLDFSTIRLRDPYVFLMQKGYPNKTILIMKSANAGDLITSIRIYRPCSTTNPTHYIFAIDRNLTVL